MDLPNGSNIKIDKLNDGFKISVPGYNFAFTLEAIFPLTMFAIIIYIMLSISLDTKAIIILSIILFSIIYFTLSTHFNTVIHFSKEKIRVRHGLLPFIRKRNTNKIKKIHVHFRGGLDGERNDWYLILDFIKKMRISILITHLSIAERDYLSAKLNSLWRTLGNTNPNKIDKSILY